MKSAAAKEEFEKWVAQAGTTVASLTPETALRMMADFYRQKPAHGVQEIDGDTLVYQWATDDSDHGRSFQWEIARQFVESGDEDEDGMSEISLTCYFPATAELESLGTGEQRCQAPDRLADFEQAVGASAAYRAVAKQKPKVVSLKDINL